MGEGIAEREREREREDLHSNGVSVSQQNWRVLDVDLSLPSSSPLLLAFPTATLQII